MTDLPVPISTDGPPIDVPLLRKAVEWAEAEAAKPEAGCEWYQPTYMHRTSCGTTYCIAGYVASLDGLVEGVSVRLPNGCAFVVGDYAQHVLGLTNAEAWRSVEGPGLFTQENTIIDIRRIAERIAARAGERL